MPPPEAGACRHRGSRVTGVTEFSRGVAHHSVLQYKTTMESQTAEL